MARLRRLAIILEEEVPQPVNPDRRLEQYRTPPELALRMVMLASESDCCRVVVDLGAGTGMISYAASLALNSYSIGVDVDVRQLERARQTRLYAMGLVDLVNADVGYMPLRGFEGYCVVENPPFGVWRRGADVFFLENAVSLNPCRIISLHKLNVESLKIIRRVLEERGYSVDCVCGDYIIIPAMFETHRRRVYRVQVAIVAASKAGWRRE